jgi:type II secretory pathway pseudopilin PulG
MRRLAFSTIELVVSLTILALAMAIVAPRLVPLRDHAAVRAATSDLGALFSRARELAMTRRQPVAIVLDSVAGTVELRANGTSLSRRGVRRLYGVTVVANRDSVVYDPRGLGYGLSNLTVTLRRGSFVDTLRMSRLGRVRW